ncbi:hypothetical protein FEK33_11425 [Nocardia asteroides NBRC 15531]|nr:hypothetical protein [Nocardia asteroides]TLF66655.1 hypothetical protein FEK33_11425 [Nocardia asteroides NBRC 15531]UGT46243.1 hypothetical protein LT345_16800 [Nocardia asteroides]SFM97463.1 hypothetical protein SAMN05444423_105184 [Nocardia asteroides]VEG34958.1 Uncharacterised protein [Nocardia asteroides]
MRTRAARWAAAIVTIAAVTAGCAVAQSPDPDFSVSMPASARVTTPPARGDRGEMGVLPGPRTEPRETGNPFTGFDRVDARTREFVEVAATWHAPPSLNVDETRHIALTLGSGNALQTQVADALEGTAPTSAGTLAVGSAVRVTLLVNESDAEVTPDGAVDASTGTEVDMRWMWQLRPKHPASALLLTAHVEIPLGDEHVISSYLGLRLPVHRTFGYTAGQVFTNWATWSAIVVSVFAASGWLLHRRFTPTDQAPVPRPSAIAGSDPRRRTGPLTRRRPTGVSGRGRRPGRR